MLGTVGGGSEYPQTSAPSFLSQRESQDPLNPVLPVTITRLFLYSLKLRDISTPPSRSAWLNTVENSQAFLGLFYQENSIRFFQQN